MKNEVIRAESESSLDFQAKAGHALAAHFLGLAAHVHQITGMDHERAEIVSGTNLAHARCLPRVDDRSAPHARTRREDLEGIGAHFPGAQSGVGRAASRAQVDADTLAHRPQSKWPRSTLFSAAA